MADYIKRDSVTNLIKLMEYPNGVIECYADEFISDINAIPSADVAEVRHGKWLWDGYVYDEPYVCNCCGARMDYESNFCSHCGARMEEWMVDDEVR